MIADGVTLQAEITLAVVVLLIFTLVRVGSVWGDAHAELGEVHCSRCGSLTSMIDDHIEALDSGDITVIEQYACPTCDHRQLRILNDAQCWAELEHDRIRG